MKKKYNSSVTETNDGGLNYIQENSVSSVDFKIKQKAIREHTISLLNSRTVL